MNKNDIINEVVSSLVFSLNKEQLELVKSTFIVKMQGYEIHELCTLPSTEVRDNDFIFKRFTVDMLAKGLKQSSIKNYMDLIRPFFDTVGKNYRDVTSQDIIDYLAIRKVKPNANGKLCSQTYISNIKARNALQKYLGRRWHGFVFRPARNILYDDVPMTTGSIEDIAKRIGKRANCHCNTTVHVYRKTFASEEYRRTGNVKYVSILLGHSSTAVTEKYYLVDDLKEIEYQALYAA